MPLPSSSGQFDVTDSPDILLFLITFLIYMCVSVYVCLCMHVRALMWRSEDNLWE